MQVFNVPTGKIAIMSGDKGQLEFLSIGDYGAAHNIKADFLGFIDDINGVSSTKVMPLEEKWVITLSTQYGCSMMCKFCDVHKVGHGKNATYNDMKNMIINGLEFYPEVEATKRLNIHYARMGEPTFNRDVLKLSYDLHKIVRPYIGNSMIHPVISTMLPKRNKNLFRFLNEWTIDIKNEWFRGDAGLQFSINSTSDEQRDDMFSGNSLSLNEISEIGKSLIQPKGRKYTLNFALADYYEVNAVKLRKLFDPNKFIVKITPLHMTDSSFANGITTTDGYDNYTPYNKVEKDLKGVGFDVLVFIPSYDEDLSRITCGNAILSGTRPETSYTSYIV